MLRVLGEIEFAAMGDAFELAEIGGGERIAIFDVYRHLRVMGKLVLRVIAEFEILFLHAQRFPPAHALGFPELVPGPGFVGMAEPFHLHLLELARAIDEVSRRYLVPEALAHLSYAKGNLYARGVDDVLVVEEDALGRLWPQVCLHRIDGTDLGPQHKVELARFSQCVPLTAIWARNVNSEVSEVVP